jgi:GNAT superfamily N-acetyltransferase
LSENGVKIRLAGAQDAEIFLELIDALADYEGLTRPDAAARQRLIHDGFGPKPRFTTLLGEVDGAPAGYAIYFETYSSFLALPTLYLEDIFVRAEYRHRKVGYQLFIECVKEAHQRGCGRMEWMVLDWNQLAIRFYERLGAKQLKEWLPFRLVRNDMESILRPITN